MIADLPHVHPMEAPAPLPSSFLITNGSTVTYFGLGATNSGAIRWRLV